MRSPTLQVEGYVLVNEPKQEKQYGVSVLRSRSKKQLASIDRTFSNRASKGSKCGKVRGLVIILKLISG